MVPSGARLPSNKVRVVGWVNGVSGARRNGIMLGSTKQVEAPQSTRVVNEIGFIEGSQTVIKNHLRQ